MYTVPLYEDLCTGVMKCFAVEVFYQTQARLHPNLRRTLQQILFQTSAVATATSTVAAAAALPCTPSPAPDSLAVLAPPVLAPPTTSPTPADVPANGTIALRDVNVSA